MVLEKRLDYGFSGCRVPVVPRASRSARGRGPIVKKCEDNQIRAFEVLASVVGKLLREGESSSPSNSDCGNDHFNIASDSVKWCKENGRQWLKAELCDREIGYEETKLHGQYHRYTLDELSHARDNFSVEGSLTSHPFKHSQEIYVGDKFAAIDNKSACIRHSGKVGGDASLDWELFEGQEEGAIERESEAKLLDMRSVKSGILPVYPTMEDAMDLDINSPTQINSEGDAQASFFRDCRGLGPFSERHANKQATRDDDKNSVRCFQNCSTVNSYRSSSNIGDRRLRNLSPSRHLRVNSNSKNGNIFKTDEKRKSVICGGRTCFNHQKLQKNFPFKKRKLLYPSLFSACNEEMSCGDLLNSSDKRTNGDNCGPGARTYASGASSLVAGQLASPDSRDCNVKLSIKSFKVPELFIEIPATATVGSLKRTVMEAVMAILGDGLHVGILLQGKKVRDDSKTLLQTGISQDDKQRTLGFMLEPRNVQINQSACSENPSFLSSVAPRGLSRHKTSLTLQPGTSSVSAVPRDINFGSSVGRNLGPDADTSTYSTDIAMSNSQALVAVPAISMEALAVVPFRHKSGNPEFGQRRIRRPFSVSEVEALVQAVEKLGTGRWRDVKLHAFGNANHRTYVDLKDKWKTLVHTARISPQQRRGEPVPQELLDRVLAAHAYWLQHQVKTQIKEAV